MRYQIYFAYGSNMDEPQFRERCPGSAILGRAVLRDYRFVIASRRYASVVPCQGAAVHGVLCALTAADEASLDEYEAVEEGMYRREFLPMETELGYRVEALVYVDTATGEGRPWPGYLEGILAGARRHGFPEAAIRELESWALAGER